jgi:hypothetical protein
MLCEVKLNLFFPSTLPLISVIENTQQSLTLYFSLYEHETIKNTAAANEFVLPPYFKAGRCGQLHTKCLSLEAREPNSYNKYDLLRERESSIHNETRNEKRKLQKCRGSSND